MPADRNVVAAVVGWIGTAGSDAVGVVDGGGEVDGVAVVVAAAAVDVRQIIVGVRMVPSA